MSAAQASPRLPQGASGSCPKTTARRGVAPWRRLVWHALIFGVLPWSGALGAPPDAERLPEGRYALWMRVVTQAEVPVLGEIKTSTTTRALVDVTRERDGLWGTQRLCEVTLGQPEGIARTVFPPALLDSLAPRRYRIDVVQRASGTHLDIDLGLDVMGFDPSRTRGALPQRSDDPGLIDVDGDRRPGATLWLEVQHLGRFPLAVVSRGQTRLLGEVVASGRAHGKASLVRFEQRVLEGMPVPGAVERVRSVEDASLFRLRAVPAQATCNDPIFDDAP